MCLRFLAAQTEIMGFYFHFRQAGARPNSFKKFYQPCTIFNISDPLDNQLHQLQLVATGKMQFLAVAVRFLTDFPFWQPVAVAVGPNMVKKPDPTGLSNTSYLMPRGTNRDRDWLVSAEKVKITGPDRRQPVRYG
jgi:hypothetical protein